MFYLILVKNASTHITKYFFLLLIFFCFIQLSSSYSNDNYFQIIEEFSFNLMDKEANRNGLQVLRHKFVFEGDAKIEENKIKLTEMKNNTFGLLYSKGEILSSELEIQMKFRILKENEHAPAFTIFLFNPEHKEKSYSKTLHLDHQENLNGIGINLFSSFSKKNRGNTSIFVTKKENGKFLEESVTYKLSSYQNSCLENFGERLTKLTIKISNNNLQIFYDTEKILHQSCLGYVNIPKSFKPPYKIGISSVNGIIEEENFIGSVEIEKLSVFNLDYGKRMHNNNLVKEIKDLSDEEKFKLGLSSLDFIKKNFESLKENLMFYYEEILESKSLENLKEAKEVLTNMMRKFEELKGRMIRIVARMKQQKIMTAKQIEINLRYFSEITSHLNEEIEKVKIKWSENKWKMKDYAESIEDFLMAEIKTIHEHVRQVEKLSLPSKDEEVN